MFNFNHYLLTKEVTFSEIAKNWLNYKTLLYILYYYERIGRLWKTILMKQRICNKI